MLIVDNGSTDNDGFEKRNMLVFNLIKNVAYLLLLCVFFVQAVFVFFVMAAVALLIYRA